VANQRPRAAIMLITFRTNKFELEPATARHLESRLLSRLSEHGTRIESLTVSLDASTSRTESGEVVCEIDVRLLRSGGFRTRAEHSEMWVAVDRAVAHVRLELERDMASAPRTAVPATAVDRSRNRALDFVSADSRISHLRPELLERPENHLRPSRVREHWPSHRDVDDGARDRNAGREHPDSDLKRRRWSRPLSRVY